MEKGLKGYRPLLLLLLCGGMTLKAAAQAAITDPLNTAQSTLTAGNTAATVKQVTESVNRLQTALDYVQKVSATVRRARMGFGKSDGGSSLPDSSWSGQNDKWAFVCLFHLYFLDSIYTIRLNFFSRSRFVMAMIVGRPCGQ